MSWQILKKEAGALLLDPTSFFHKLNKVFPQSLWVLCICWSVSGAAARRGGHPGHHFQAVGGCAFEWWAPNPDCWLHAQPVSHQKTLKFIFGNLYLVYSWDILSMKCLFMFGITLGIRSSACSSMQIKALVEHSRAPSVYYLGLYLQDDAVMMENNMSNVPGVFMSKWFDQSESARPSRRSSSSFTEHIPTLKILTVADNQLKILSGNLYFFLYILMLLLEMHEHAHIYICIHNM